MEEREFGPVGGLPLGKSSEGQLDLPPPTRGGSARKATSSSSSSSSSSSPFLSMSFNSRLRVKKVGSNGRGAFEMA